MDVLTEAAPRFGDETMFSRHTRVAWRGVLARSYRLPVDGNPPSLPVCRGILQGKGRVT